MEKLFRKKAGGYKNIFAATIKYTFRYGALSQSTIHIFFIELLYFMASTYDHNFRIYL